MSLAFEAGLISAGAVGFLLMFYGFLSGKNQRPRSVLSVKKKRKVGSPGLFDNLLDKIPLIKKSEEKIEIALSVLDMQDANPRTITKTRMVYGFVGLAIAILLRNIMVVPLLVFVFAFIPIVFLNRKLKKRRSLYNEQVQEALQVFVTDYTTTKSVQKTLENVCLKVKRPLRGEFERLVRRLNSGVPANDCFLEFSKRTQNQWIVFFSQVMMMYFRNGGDIVPHLTGIVRTMSTEKLIEEQNNTELAGLKNINFALVLLFPVVFVISVLVSPDTVRIFTETMPGRMIVFFSVAGCLFSLFVGQKIIEN